MNTSTNFNVSPGSSDIGLLAAGLILAYGVWMGRRDLGVRAALGVLGTLLLASLPIGLFGGLVFGRLFTGGLSGPLAALVLFILPAMLNLSLALLPLYVAVNWMEVIRDAVRPRS